MNSTIESSSAAASGNKALWVVVAVLGATVVGMGGYLMRGPTRAVESGAAAVPALVAAPAATSAAGPLNAPQAAPVAVPAPVAAAPAQSPMITEKKDGTPVTTPKAPAKPAPVVASQPAPSSVAKPAPTTAAPATPMAQAPQVNIPPPPKVVCLSCGTVTAVTPIQREGVGSGAGAVAGGVLGGVLGNQVGGGDGKTIATILGAIGGGMAGNAVEKKMKKETVYQVDVRMEDGSTRSFEQTAPTSVGAKVVLEGDGIRPAN